MSNTVSSRFGNIGPDVKFQQGLKDGRFVLQMCGSCQHHVFYPRMFCTHCGSKELAWVEPLGRATVYACTTSHTKDRPQGAYNISVVELAEGPRMFTRVVDVSPDEVFIGMSVTAFVGDIDGVAVVLFRPERGAVSHG